MAYNDVIRKAMQPASLTALIAAAANGAVVPGPTLFMGNVEKGTLSARVNLLAQTTSLTLSAVWEVSRDGVTWVRAPGVSNASPVAIATGTGGVDTAVVRQIDAPNAAYSHRFARCSVLLGGAGGAAGDQGDVSYDYCDSQGI